MSARVFKASSRKADGLAMMRARRVRSADDGFTLIESIVAQSLRRHKLD